jgi:MerR family copper efflux transcriptional regulator
MRETGTYTIGQLAARADVGVETVRFYEREGLLAQPSRPPGGFRRYPQDALERVRFIRKAKDLGFTLEEIRDLFSLRAARGTQCEGVKARALAKVEEVEEKLRALRRLRGALVRLVDSCHGECDVDECGILASLSGHHH